MGRSESGPVVPRIGITGHTTLSPDTTDQVYRCLTEQLDTYPAAPHGVTCLAAGADQLFARAILATGGTFEVILPAPDYRELVVTHDQRAEFDDLIRLAADVTVMPFSRSGEAAYMAASHELIRRSDVLFAVWDGTRSGRLGETGEVVAAAKLRHMPVTVLWPPGGRRT